MTNTTISDKKTTLVNVAEDGVTLECVVVYEVAGKRFSAQPERFKEGFHGDLGSNDLKIKETGSGHVVIEGRKIACSVLRLEFSGPTSKTVTNIHYSPRVAPYVLKKQSVVSNPSANDSRNETTIEVVSLDMPCRVLAELQSAAYVKTVLRHHKGTVSTLAATSTGVPGGVVWHTSKELDTAGRLIRRSTLELIDYGLEPEPGRTAVLGRRRNRLLRGLLPLRRP